MKKWKFNGGLKVGEIYYHHGFKIASHLILWLTIALVGVDMSKDFTPQMIMKLSLFVGVLQSLVVWIHDIYALRFGAIETVSYTHLTLPTIE